MTEPAPTPAPAPAPPAPAPEPVEGPPLLWLLAYRLLGLRLPDRYRPWVARDVAGKHFLTLRMARTFLWTQAFVGLFWVARTTVSTPPTSRMLIRLALVGLALSLLASGKTLVRRTLHWQRVNRLGHPVPGSGFAAAGNAQAVLLGVAVLVAFTGGVAALAYERRPERPTCPDADDAVMDRLRSGLKNPESRLFDGKQVDSGSKQLVAVKARVPGEDNTLYWLYVIDGDTVLELREPVLDDQSPTSFPTYGGNIDRGLNLPLVRLAGCLDTNRRRP